MGLNVGPLMKGFFSVVNTVLLHDLRLVESADRKERRRGGPELAASYVQTFDCPESQHPSPLVVQGSAVVEKRKLILLHK